MDGKEGGEMKTMRMDIKKNMNKTVEYVSFQSMKRLRGKLMLIPHPFLHPPTHIPFISLKSITYTEESRDDGPKDKKRQRRGLE